MVISTRTRRRQVRGQRSSRSAGARSGAAARRSGPHRRGRCRQSGNRIRRWRSRSCCRAAARVLGRRTASRSICACDVLSAAGRAPPAWIADADSAGAAHSGREPVRLRPRSFEAELHAVARQIEGVTVLFATRHDADCAATAPHSCGARWPRLSASSNGCSVTGPRPRESRSWDTPTATAIPRRTCRLSRARAERVAAGARTRGDATRRRSPPSASAATIPFVAATSEADKQQNRRVTVRVWPPDRRRADAERRTMIQKKICMLGSFAVGKTSLVSRFVSSIFSEKYHTTVGVKIDKKTLTLDRKRCRR